MLPQTASWSPGVTSFRVIIDWCYLMTPHILMTLPHDFVVNARWEIFRYMCKWKKNTVLTINHLWPKSTSVWELFYLSRVNLIKKKKKKRKYQPPSSYTQKRPQALVYTHEKSTGTGVAFTELYTQSHRESKRYVTLCLDRNVLTLLVANGVGNNAMVIIPRG